MANAMMVLYPMNQAYALRGDKNPVGYQRVDFYPGQDRIEKK
jgi:hypothetical protein